MSDFSPNQRDFCAELDDFRLGETISNQVRDKMKEIVVRLSKNAADQLRQIGLWPVIELLPYPLSKIIERVEEGELSEARTILVQHCNSDFLLDLISKWMPVEVFMDRKQVFDEALFAHGAGKYIPSVYTLVPQIEGIITDWLFQIPSGQVDWKIESKIEQFRAEIEKVPQMQWAYKESFASVIEFMTVDEPGTPLKTFTNWLERIDPAFPNRHVVTHGRYDKDIFTEENSIKLFLLLDTICQFMMFYEVRVLGKDLGQNTEVDDS